MAGLAMSPRIGGQHVWTEHALADSYGNCPVLVVGADGFLGINCTCALRAFGAEVSILSRRVSPRLTDFTGRVFRGDLKDIEIVRCAVDNQQIVIDFAGGFGAAGSNRDPEKSFREEFIPKLNLVRSCAEAASRPLLVFCSSRLVYGAPFYLPVDEFHPLRPQSAYAVQKLGIERCLRSFAESHRLRYCVLRLSNAYGPRDRPSSGYGIINQFCRAAIEGRPITIFGDGNQRRDFIYVTDVITATLACAVTKDCENEVFNLGGREWISIADAAHLISALAGGTPIRHVAWPEEAHRLETGNYRSDLRKLDRRLILPPPVPFDEGVARTLRELRRSEDSAMEDLAG